MMICGLSRSEKLNAIRIFIDNEDIDVLNKLQHEISCMNEKCHEIEHALGHAINSIYENAEYLDFIRINNNWGEILYARTYGQMRLVSGYAGSPELLNLLLDAELEWKKKTSLLQTCKSMFPIMFLCLDNEGDMFYIRTDDDNEKYYMYEGREHNGDFCFTIFNEESETLDELITMPPSKAIYLLSCRRYNHL